MIIDESLIGKIVVRIGLDGYADRLFMIDKLTFVSDKSMLRIEYSKFFDLDEAHSLILASGVKCLDGRFVTRKNNQNIHLPSIDMLKTAFYNCDNIVMKMACIKTLNEGCFNLLNKVIDSTFDTQIKTQDNV